MTSNGNPRQRLFFALWPDRGLQTHLADLVAGGPPAFGRRIPAENLHLTLAFLGHLDAGARACVESAADSVESAAFDLEFTRLGCWPRPRVIWAGTDSTPDALGELVDSLRRVMAGCGLEPETRPYRAHITLARKTRTRADFHRALAPVGWRVDAFHLVQSTTLASGARYQRLRTWPLGG